MNRTQTILAITCTSCLALLAVRAWAQDADDALPRKDAPTLELSRDEPGPIESQRPARRNQSDFVVSPHKPPVSYLFTQNLADSNVPVREPDGPMRRRVVTETTQIQRVIQEPLSAEEIADAEAFQAALQILKEAKDEAARTKAGATIKQQVLKQFDQDLNQRERELATVEERVKSLREQLEKRKSAKDDIVNLRIKTILNHAAGLGFPGDTGPAESAFSFTDPDAQRTFGNRRGARPAANPTLQDPFKREEVR